MNDSGHSESDTKFQRLLLSLSNWGRWGPSDERGALNLIGAGKVKEAAGLVRTGEIISLALPIASGKGPQSRGERAGRINPLHLMTATGWDEDAIGALGPRTGYSDDLLLLSPQGGTHWDSLSHIHYNGEMYNGVPTTAVGSKGAKINGIAEAYDGFVSRGVLLDIANLKGVECLPEGYRISISDLEEAEDRSGLKVSEGDILLVRTGLMAMTDGLKDWSVFSGREPGLEFDTVEFLNDRSVAAVCSDNPMVEAPGQLPNYKAPFHMLAVVNLGIHLGEYWYFEELAESCKADEVYEFLLAAQGLPIVGGTGTPVAPLAIK